LNNVYIVKQFILNRFKFLIFILFLPFACQNDESKGGVDIDITQVEKSNLFKFENLDSSRIEKIDKYFSYRNKIGRFNGVVLFADSNKVFTKAYGYSNYQTKDSLEENTSFQLASVSKTITATAVMMLVEKGDISLSDTIQKHLPKFPYRGITIESLLTHRSGLGNYIYWSENYWPDQYEMLSNDKVLDLMIEHQPSVYSSPNRKYFYNNTNYELLATIIERVSGESFPEFLKENIFDPLGMLDSFVFDVDSLDDKNIAIGYKNRRRPYSYFFLDGVYGDKGIYSTALDMLKFDLGLRNGLLLSDQTMVDAYTNRSKPYRKPYGLGWRLYNRNGRNIVYHHGWWRGFKTYFVRSMDDNKTVVVLTNNLRSSSFNNLLLLNLLSD
jgi:CubicO group peptidase (beta-lactamase class C family)